MKSNHIPTRIRLLDRIHKLENKEDAAWVKIGRGNPYLKCKYCGVTNVEVTSYGHHKGCEIKGIEKEIAHYRTLLDGNANVE